MTIGVFVDFRNDKFIHLYKKILKKNKKLVFFGQKKYLEIIKNKIGVKNCKYYSFNQIVSNNLNINQNLYISYVFNFLIVLKNFFYSYYILKSNSIRTILVSDDRSPDMLLSFIRHSKKNNIKVILIPSGIFSAKKFVIQNRKKNIKKFYSNSPILLNKHLYSRVNKKIIYFYKKNIVWLYKLFNLFPVNPWISGSNVDQAFFLSDASKIYYIKQGFKSNLIKNLGSYDLNEINIKKKFLKKKLFKKKYKISNDKKIIIFMPNPWFEHNITSYEEGYKRNYEIIEYIKKISSSKKINCLISLHPKQAKKNYLWIEKTFNFKIIDEKLFNIIDCSDLFLISYESDTMIWSADLNIPCIITNFFNEKSSVFKFKNLYFCNTRSIFQKTIKKLLSQKNNNTLNIDIYKKKQNDIADHLLNENDK